MESKKHEACDGIKKKRSRKTQIHKMHPVFIEFYHFLVEIILFINNANKVFLRTFKYFKVLIFPHLFQIKMYKSNVKDVSAP